MEMNKVLHQDLVQATRRILRLGPSELRVTDAGLICKNPNYSVCDAMLKTDTVYCVEYLLSYWESRTDHVPCFIFKNTGCAVSLCCFVRAPVKLVSPARHVGEFNVLKVNESLIVTLKDIEEIKPSAYGVLTKCVVRKSNSASVFNIELIAFGPENEGEYENLLRELYAKKAASTSLAVRNHVTVSSHSGSGPSLWRARMSAALTRTAGKRSSRTASPPPPPPRHPSCSPTMVAAGGAAAGPRPPPPPMAAGSWRLCRCEACMGRCGCASEGDADEEEEELLALAGEGKAAAAAAGQDVGGSARRPLEEHVSRRRGVSTHHRHPPSPPCAPSLERTGYRWAPSSWWRARSGPSRPQSGPWLPARFATLGPLVLTLLLVLALLWRGHGQSSSPTRSAHRD
ncbi:UL50 [Human betaherpesvirus 5]|nr:UL50 [Human betaherpesvirus 5]QNT12607.1 UL50 [Human betaherpesvirus 5]